MEVFSRLFHALNEAPVKYMVAGGIAVNLYGIERATADIDIILPLNEENISNFIRVVRNLGLKPKVPVQLEDLADANKRREWIEEKGLMVFSLFDPKNSFFLLDVMIGVPFDFDTVYARKKEVGFQDLVIPLVPLSDLIEMKEKAGRLQDMADVYYLRRIKEIWDDEG